MGSFVRSAPSSAHVRSHRQARPRLERLEDRLAPAIGQFIEDFSDDLNPADRGFDSWDADPGTTVPDALHILHGSTSLTNIRTLNTAPSPPHHLLLTPGTYTASFPTPGSPGGFAANEEVAFVTVQVLGLGTVRFVGEQGRFVDRQVNPSATWQTVLITRESRTADGQLLGGIQRIEFFTFEALGVDDITVFVDVPRVNHPPVAHGDSIIIPPGTDRWQFFVMDNDIDPDGDGMEIVEFTQGEHGTVEESPHPGHLSYTPSGDGARNDQFTYTIRDEYGATATATVFVTTNQRPSGPPLRYIVPHGTHGSFDEAGLLDGAQDPDSDPLTLRLFQPPEHGIVEIRPDGTFTYTPTTPDGRVLSDQFQYDLFDGFEFGDSIVVRIDVPNAPPVAALGQWFLPHGTPGPLRGIVGVTDADGDPILAATIVDPPSHGGLALRTVNGQAEFEYFANSGDLRGSDSFTFAVFDGYEWSNVGRIEIIVPNIPPTASDFTDADMSVLGPHGSTAVTGNLLNHAGDTDRDPLQPLIGPFRDPFGNWIGAPQHGTVTVAPDGTFTYTPTPGYHVFGTDTFAYAVSDGYEFSNVAWVTIRQGLGRGITASNSFSVVEGQRLVVHTGVLLGNDRFDTGLPAAQFAYGLRITRNGEQPGETRLYRGDNDAPIHNGDMVPAGIGMYFQAPNLGSNVHSTTYRLEYEFVFLNPLDAQFVTPETLVSSNPAQVLIQVSDLPDADGDGVWDGYEAFLIPPYATQGDGNQDGVEDVFQPNVATLSTALVGGDVVTFEVSGGGSFYDLRAISNPSPADSPQDAQWFAFFGFNVTGLEILGRAQVVITLPSDLTVARFYKYGLGWHTVPNSNPPIYIHGTDGWYDFSYDGRTGAIFGNNRITLFLEDGARGDGDGEDDGIITDPFGIAVVPSADTTPPAVSPPDLAAADDSGNSDTDDVTNRTLLHFAGTAEAGAAVDLREGSIVLGSALAGPDGAWSVATALTEGTHLVMAVATDAAGNSATSAALAVTVDTTAPVVALDPASGTYLPGMSFTWSGSDALSRLVESVVTIDGAPGVSIPSGGLPMPPGTHAVAFAATDTAGNAASISRTYTTRGIALVGSDIVAVGTDANDVMTFTPGVFGSYVATIVSPSPSGTSVMIGIFRPRPGGWEWEASVNGHRLGIFVAPLPNPLGRFIAYGLGGNDTMLVTAVDMPAWLNGADGNDLLVGGGGHDILLGGDGNDDLNGGHGRDLLVGGRGRDRLNGGTDDDLLIAGFTDLDDDPAGLATVSATWSSSQPYAARRGSLLTLLAADLTVHDDGAKDSLTGGTGQDWFFAKVDSGGILDVIDRSGSEAVERLH